MRLISFKTFYVSMNLEARVQNQRLFEIADLRRSITTIGALGLYHGSYGRASITVTFVTCI